MIIFSENIHYLDPGTGSYLYQALLAAGITAGIYFRNLKIFAASWMNKIKNLIKKEN